MRKVEEIIRNKIEQVLNRKFITCKNNHIFQIWLFRFLCNAKIPTFPAT